MRRPHLHFFFLEFAFAGNLSVSLPFEQGMMKQIRIYKFQKRKYGDELLIDVLDLDHIKPGIRKAPVHRESFYCIILITEGSEEVAVNGNSRTVGPGDFLCSRPGEVWSWSPDPKLEGLVLIFEEAFLRSFFSDPHFLDRFAYLQADRKSPFLHPDPALRAQLESRLQAMRDEIGRTEKDPHMLRAMLYETLVLLHRAENDGGCISDPPSKEVSVSRYIDEFVRSVDADYAEQHDVAYYADRLCITPNYLNKIVRQTLGTTAKAYIQHRLFEEAERLLSYTTLAVAEIAECLHFDSPSYFVRFFRKHAGRTPLQYRESGNRPQK